MKKVEKDDENLQDTMLSVLVVGGFIFILWFVIFGLYVTRLNA
ncbi:MAG: cytochrome c oxidase subunit 2A [Kyrpidia sp.]|nr:cytochrome c oxidase subunit 2A [Kyrpidia sp.]